MAQRSPDFHLTFLVLLLLAGELIGQTQTTGPRVPSDRNGFGFDMGDPKLSGPVKWEYDGTLEFVRDEYAILDGNVRITYQDVKVRADKVKLNLKTKDLEAEGDVIVDQGPRRLVAKRIEYNLDTKTGKLYEASGAVDPSINFSGELVEKISDDTYRITNGVFTSCDPKDPDWSFHLASGEITTNDYARLRDITFRANNLPIIYLPRLIWPTKPERSQGLLFPKFGQSSRFGYYLGTSYFIPHGDSADTTISADTYTNGFFGLGSRFRYVPTTAIKGDLSAYAVYSPGEENVPGFEKSGIEWKYDYTHTQENLPGGFRGVIDIQDYSDIEFFRSFSRDFALNSITNIYSAAYLTRNTARYALNIRADRRKLFGGETSRVFEQVPSIEFRSYPNRLGGTPLYLSVESSASHLRSSLGANYYRADLFPTLSMQVKTPRWFSIKPQLSVRQTYYTASRDPQQSNIVDQSLSRFYAQGQIELVGPSISKIYPVAFGGFSRFKHLIEPRFRYLYTSDVNNQNQVVQFDTVDSPFLPIVRDSVEYSLTQRLIARSEGEGRSSREILSVSLRQTAALSKPFERFVGGRQTHTFTPLTLNVHANPYQAITVDANAAFGNISHQLDRLSISANLIDAPRNRFLGLTYFSSYRSPGINSEGSSQIRINSGSPIIPGRFRADVQVNYDARTARFLEQRYLLNFTASCYGVGVELRDFLDFRSAPGGRRTQELLVSLSLTNVGKFIDFQIRPGQRGE